MERAMDYQPQVVVNTDGLPHEEWLEYRRQGIGGSDAAAVLGISPFLTCRDLYYDKLKLLPPTDDENWAAKRIGKLLEPAVSEIFAYRTGLKVYRKPFMYRHPQYPWMLADLDYAVEERDGSFSILECKSTNYNARSNWWYNKQEIVPAYYETQGRHYLAVMNCKRVYFCCLYGNTEDEAEIRVLDRDMSYEEELIALEEIFWHDHVLAKVPPPYTENGDMVLESLRRLMGPPIEEQPPVQITDPQFVWVQKYLQLQEEKRVLDHKVKALQEDMKSLKAKIIASMGNSGKAVYEDACESYSITYKSSYRMTMPKANLERLKLAHPDIYEEYAAPSEETRFNIRKAALNAA